VFPDVPRRTLQRRLADLVAEGALIAEGNARARRYRAAARAMAATSADESPIPLSPQGHSVRTEISRPLAQRRPVGYRSDFLDSYQPNVSFFLPRALREHLHRLGRSPVDGAPAGTYARQVLDRLLIDLSWASSRLEGNTYTRLDTENLIQFGQLAAGKDQ